MKIYQRQLNGMPSTDGALDTVVWRGEALGANRLVGLARPRAE